ncbi:MAG: hypothetical protein ACKV2V_03645 [Blastocatellia bacterium]
MQRLRQEIAGKQRQLEPRLVEARRDLAQVDLDLEVATKHHSVKMLIAVLVMSFCLTMSLRVVLKTISGIFQKISNKLEAVEKIGDESPTRAAPQTQAASLARASDYYETGEILVRQKKFSEAALSFEQAFRLVPKLQAGG